MAFGTQANAPATSGLTYLGGWNASSNTPTIVSGVGTNGDYYIVTTAGTTNIDGISSWGVGDWIIFNGTVWQKIDNSDDTSWQLNGNTLTSQKYIGTNSNHDFPIYTNGTQKAIFLKTGEFGVNIPTPTAMGHFKGSTNDNSAYAFKAENLAGSNLFYLRNDQIARLDGYIGIGRVPGTVVDIQGTDDASSRVRIYNSTTNSRAVFNAICGTTNLELIVTGQTYAASGSTFPEENPSVTTLYSSSSGGFYMLNAANGPLGWGSGNGGTGIPIRMELTNTGVFTNIFNGKSASIPVSQSYSGDSIPTTNATITPIQTIDLSVTGAYVITSRIPYRKTAGTGVGTVGDGGSFIITQCFKNVAGTVTATGTLQNDYTGTLIGTEVVIYTISGTNILVQATGMANDSIVWGPASTVNKI